MSEARHVIAKEMQSRRDFSYSTPEYWLADADALLTALDAAGFAIVSKPRSETLQEKRARCQRLISEIAAEVLGDPRECVSVPAAGAKP